MLMRAYVHARRNDDQKVEIIVIEKKLKLCSINIIAAFNISATKMNYSEL